jgi:hypothetical protein
MVVEDADGAYERCALLALAWSQLAVLGPSRELTMRRESQRVDVIARQAMRVAHGVSSRTANSMSHKSP